jgi:hypothetical protein
MFCPQCGVQAEQQTKFCKSCGLRLADHAQLIAASRESDIGRMSQEEARRQLRWLKGTRSLLISTLMLPLITLMVGAAAGSHGPDAEVFGFISFFLICLWLGISGRGFFNLVRGGFFKTYKERRIRAEAALLAQPGPVQPPESTSLPPDTNRIYPRIGAVSVAEPTTRELRQVGGNSGSGQ